MKILQVNKLYWPWVGGVEKVVQQIAEGLNRREDLEIKVLCCQSKGERKEGRKHYLILNRFIRLNGG